MTTFQTNPTVNAEDFHVLLTSIYSTFNVDGKINTFQINKVAANILSNALFVSLRTTNARDGFESRLVRHAQTAYGIANAFHFTPDFEWNINNQKDRFYEQKVPTQEAVMKKIMTRLPNKYGVNDKVTAMTVGDVILEMEFADITELDEKWNETSYKNDLRVFMGENRAEIEEIKRTLQGECEQNETEYSFQMLLDYVKEKMLPIPEPVTAYERLEKDAANSVEISKKMTDETWNKVSGILAAIDTTLGLETIDGVDGLDGEDRYKLVKSIQGTFDWSQKDSNEKLGEIALNPEMESMESLHANNLSGAMAIIPICNKLVEEAEQTEKSNTSDEISREFEEGHSNNMSDDGINRHAYEVDNNLPHGTVGG